MKKMTFILGSKSPRRKELLGASFIDFKIHSSDIEENSTLLSVEEKVQDIALQKAVAVYQTLNNTTNFILGADTVVVLDGKTLEKPADITEARKMLLRLSGRSHEVYTGVAFVRAEQRTSFFVKTVVTFHHITEDLLELYLATGDSLDKAGAYGIQGQGLSFIKEVLGSYSNVVGLPIDQVIIELKKFLGYTGDESGSWRELFE
ncbi:MAG: septum formation protein Maf [Halobacteriovoraceae bacterium]|nr:septum formation protein Maf [Halobacteriovoraceae bacterium]